MKVVNPNNSEHTIIFIPRFEISNVSFNLYNEFTRENTDVAVTPSFIDGFLSLTFNYTFVEGDKYQLKVTDNDVVMYRGKLFATSQETQDFKELKGYYEWK